MERGEDTQQRFSTASVLVIALVLLSTALYAWQLAALQREERARVIAETDKRAVQLTNAVAGYMASFVRNVDFVLLEVRRDFGVNDGRFRAISESLLGEFPPQSLLQLSFADAGGNLIYSNLGLAEKISIRDREHFTAHLAGGDHLYISRPLLGRVSKVWTIQFSRPIIRNGRFAGVAVLSLSPEYLSQVLATLELASGDSIGLVGLDGRVLARNRDVQSVLGRDLGQTRPFMLPGAEPRGTYRAKAFSDGVERYFAWQRLPGTGLVAIVGLDPGAALVPLEAGFRRQWINAAALSVALIALGIAALVLLARLSRRQRDIAASEARFRSLTNLSVDWYWEQDENFRLLAMEGATRDGVAIDSSAYIGKFRWDQPALNMTEADWARHRALLQAHLPFRDLELRRPDMGRRTPWVSISGEPVFDVSGVFRGYRGTGRDISDRKRSEALFEGQRRILESIVMGAQIGEVLTSLVRLIEEQAPEIRASVLLIDAEGRRLRHGAAPSLPESFVRAIDGVAIGEHAGSCGTAAFRRAEVITGSIETDASWEGYREAALAHGLRACWSTPILDAQGRLLGTFAMYFDEPGGPSERHRRLIEMATHVAAIGITRRRQEDELLESEARFRSLTELSSDWYWELDRDLRISFVSASFEERTGLATASVMGNYRWTDPGRQPLQGTWADHRATLEAHLPFHEFETFTVDKDGERMYSSVSGVPIYDASGQFAGYRGIGARITARKKAEEALRVSEQRLRAIFESEPECVKVVSIDGLLLEMNPAGMAMVGADTPEQVLDRPLVELVAENHRAAFINLHRKVIAGDNGKLEFEIVDLKGDRRWLDTHATPLRGPDGRVTALLGITRDITERKRAETDQKRLEAQLHQAQKMDALGTLAGGVAHDFNNMLAAILGNVELARLDLKPGDRALTSLAEIENAGERARDLVNQILSFSRRQPQQLQRVQLRTMAEDAIRLLRASLPAGIELAPRFAGDTPDVMADATQIHQVMMNLGSNAMHAIGDRQGRIEFSLERVVVDGGMQGVNLPPGSYARLSVTDTGTGMETGTMERIFDPFFTTKPPGKGTGLGLSVVSGIMKNHGGTITVYSEPGKGSSFQLYFPEASGGAGAEAGIAGRPSPVPVRGDGLRVLFVDDEEALVTMTVQLLGRSGYAITGHVHPSQALAAFRADPSAFDIMVTDFNMPGQSGVELAREILRLRPDMPIALASGYVTEELRAIAIETGIREVLYKPVSLQALAQTIQRLAART